jgi:cytochrome c oxidase subunit 1
VSGTAIAFMGLTYYVIPLIFRKRIAFYPLAKIQPWLFAIGMLVFSLMMTFAGTFGVPRRHWDITFSGAPFDVQFNPAVNLVMGIMALGGLMAAAGGGIYILVTVWSVFFGEKLPDGPLTGHGLPPGIVNPPKPIPAGEHSRKAPGTLVLVFVFLAAFIAYYFINWKLLSVVWKIG